jgi:Mn-dependent DtxR family transcriptional regulator
VILDDVERRLLSQIYAKVSGREKRYLPVDVLAGESGLCPEEFSRVLAFLDEEDYIEVKPFRMLRITHKGILACEEGEVPEKREIRNKVMEKIKELSQDNTEIFIIIDALAGEMNLMRYELFDILNYLQGEGLVKIHSRISVSLCEKAPE